MYVIYVIDTINKVTGQVLKILTVVIWVHNGQTCCIWSQLEGIYYLFSINYEL